MIYLKMHGNLGNQFFQYAFARRIQILNGEKIVINFSKSYKKGFKNCLNYFNVSYFEIFNDWSFARKIIFIIQNLKLFLIDIIAAIYRRFCKVNRKFLKFLPSFYKFLNKSGVYTLIEKQYYDFDSFKCKKTFINGDFENIKYFDCIRDVLKNEFTPKESIISSNEELYKIIKSSNSVGISIRRGDFLSKKNFGRHLVCNAKYYEKAIKKIYDYIDDPKFIVFSDDINWCKCNLKFPKNTSFETGKDPVWEKLRLGYSCKNFIISNSTFSWWLQYLSESENKVVISPSRWFNNDINKSNQLILDDFIVIDI